METLTNYLSLRSKHNELFEKMDVDNSGYIEFNEFYQVLVNIYKIDLSLEELAMDIFLYADGNGTFNSRDGKLNKSEFRKFSRAAPEPTEYSTPKEALMLLLFKLIDINDNQYIEFNEFEIFYKRVARTGCSDAEIKQAFNLLKRDELNRVAKSDFIEYINKQ